MSYGEYKSNRRKACGSVEFLDDRVLLNAGGGMPATPPPAASPVSVAVVRRFERDVEKLDRAFMHQSKQLNSFVIRRSNQLEAMLASTASRAQVQVQRALDTPGTTSPVSLGTQNQAAQTQLGRAVAAFNIRLNQLNNGLEQQFGVVATPLAQVDARAGVPASALENNLNAARAAFTTSVKNAVSSVTAQVQTQASAVTSAASTAATGTSATSTTGTTTASTSTTANGITATQTFSNAFTQAFSSLNTSINSVNATLAQELQTFQTQFANSLSSAVSAFSTTPLATLLPTVTFVSGTGVTFTST
jgi:hypothetical protein